MSSSTPADSRPEPRYPLLIAVAVFIAAALSLLWPILQGQFLAGEDQVSAGYAFRALATASMRAGHGIPQWNPFILGGMPLWAVPGHFDVFYPTAWLRWILNADTVLDWSFFIHFVVAGIAMYMLLRTLRTGWAAAMVGGLAYEFSGILASQVSPGHDGKLYAAALAPFAFVALIRAVRWQQQSAYGWLALVIGLVLLTPHYLAAYYLLIALALFTLWLVFLDPERPVGRSPVTPLVMTAVAVAVGFGIAAVELLPVQHSVALTPRAAGGNSVGYDYASTWGMAPEELATTILPQFNGVLAHYWGRNPMKNHTEYVGVIVAILALLGIPAARRRKVLLPLAVIGVLFMMAAWGGYSDFYHLWILLPRMEQFRAPGLAFYITALVVCVLAGLGADDLLAGLSSRRMLIGALSVLGVIALFAGAGLLQGLAEGLAIPGREQYVIANQPELQSGGLRMLVVVLAGGAMLWLIQRGKLVAWQGVAALVVIVGLDNWSILRLFPQWLPPASVTFADDNLTSMMKKQSPLPFRAYTPSAPDAGNAQIDALTVYSASSLMARDIPSLLGYHGMESRYFDALLGTKNIWQYQYAQNMWDLYGVKYVIQTTEPTGLARFHKEMGPVELTDNRALLGSYATQAVVMERDSAIQWVRVVPTAVKVAEEQIPPTIADPRFPVNSYVLFPDSSTVTTEKVTDTLPKPTPVKAKLLSWEPGAMHVALDGTDPRPTWLVVAENWYPDWHVQVDGKTVPVYRGDGALLTIPIAPGAKDVKMLFDIAAYHQGKAVSIFALALTLLMLVAPRLRNRTADA
ncbi:MAG TPA: hypothetical protein VGM77_08435 [Gemmatimonadales bacterium]